MAWRHGFDGAFGKNGGEVWAVRMRLTEEVVVVCDDVGSQVTTARWPLVARVFDEVKTQSGLWLRSMARIGDCRGTIREWR